MGRSSLLWSIQPPGGQMSYLFGTMHVRDYRVYQLCENLYPLIRSCDVYVAEMDLEPQQVVREDPRYAIEERFPPKVLQRIHHQLYKSFAIDVRQLGHLHPLLIISAISLQILRHDHQISLDEHFWRYASDQGMNLQGLESTEEQIEILHSLDPGPLYQQIRKISKQPSAYRGFTNKTMDLYLESQLHLLYRMTKNAMHQLRGQLIYRRNRIMVNRIAGFDVQLRYFIAVGAGHLSGKYGLITLLRQQGWSVHPVSYNPAMN